MLNLSCTLIHQSREIPFVPGCQVKEEGVALVSMLVDGKEAVKPFEGSKDISAGARFAGFSYSETLTPVTANYAMAAVTDKEGNVILPYEPITGQISVWTHNADGTRTRVESAKVVIDSANPRMIKIGGDAAAPSQKVSIVFKYMPTIQSAFFEHRVLIPTVSASAMTNSTGVILEGEVWTDKIDLGSDFDKATNKLYVNADGLVASGASVPSTGVEINGTVIGTPNAANGFLGIRF